VKDFIQSLPDTEAAEVVAAMAEVRNEGLPVARHLRGAIYEVRAEGHRSSFRVLFAQEGRRSHVLLALEAFEKKTRKTPDRLIQLAETRLSDWRARGRRTRR
jgi:phage-related protein